MANFWEFESEETYNQKTATEWAAKARQDAFSLLAQQSVKSSGNSPSLVQTAPGSIFNRKYLSEKDLTSIQPEAGKVSNRKKKGLLDSITSTVFLGDVDQPWDLLRPIQRVLEAENRYVAKPIAQGVLGFLPGEYDDLPGIVRMGAETLFDPLTYLGPGAITKVGKLAAIAPKMKFTAPALEALMKGPGSRRVAASILADASAGIGSVLGATAAQEVGLPPIVGSITGGLAGGGGMRQVIQRGGRASGDIVYVTNPEDMPVFHGTTHPFEGLPSPSSEKSRNFPGTSVKGAIYGSTDPYVTEGFTSVGPGEAPRVIPMVLQKGTRYWDPEVDPFPKLFDEDLKDLLELEGADHVSMDMIRRARESYDTVFRMQWNTFVKNRLANIQRGQETAFLDWLGAALGDRSGERARDALVGKIRSEGYQAIKTGKEVVVLDPKVLKPFFDESRFPANQISNAKPIINQLAKAKTNDELADMVLALDPMDQMRLTLELQAKDPKMMKQLQELVGARRRLQEIEARQAEVAKFKSKAEAQKAGVIGVTPEELSLAKESLTRLQARAQDMTARVNALRKSPPISGGTMMSDSAQEFHEKLATAPVNYFNARDLDEIGEYVRQRKNVMTSARGKMAETLPQPAIDFLKRRGIRLRDSSIQGEINEHARLAALGPNYGAAINDEMDLILKRASESGDLLTDEVHNLGTVVRHPDLIQQAKEIEVEYPSLRLLDDSGNLYLDDLQKYSDLFNLTDKQRNILDALDAPLASHLEFERMFKLRGAYNYEKYGKYAHRQALKIGVEGDLPAAETVQVSPGPVVGQRYNTRQTFQRPESFESHAAGVVNGNTYLPYAEAQSARVAQGYKALADEWLGRQLEGIGKSVSDLVPKPLADELVWRGKLRGHIDWMQREVTRADQSGARRAWISPKWAPDPELVPLIDRMNWASNLSKMSDRRAQYKVIRDQLNELQAHHDSEWRRLKAQKAEITDLIKFDKTSEYRRPYPVEFHGKYYPKSLGEALQDIDRINTPEGIEGFLTEFNNYLRPVMSTLDLSFMGVQGLVALLSNPMAFARAAKTLFSNGYGDYEAALRRSGRLNTMLNAGVHWAARNDANEFLFPSAIAKLPVVGPLSELSNSYFSQFSNVLRSEIFHSAFRDGMSTSELEQLGRSVNLITGFSPNDPTSVEKSLVFAPRFYRSQFGLISDAISKRDMSTGGAARALSSLIVSGSLLTIAANEALGQETDFDPESPNFMRIRFGGNDFSIFGTWDSLARSMTKLVSEGPKEAAEYMARTKASPAVSRAFDLLSGESLSGFEYSWGSPGDIIESAAKFSSGFLPISAQQLITDTPNPRDPASFVASGLQFLGTKSTPLSASEKMAIKRDQVAQQAFQKDFADLEPYQQDQLRDQYGLVSPARSDVAKSFEYRRAITGRYTQEQDRIDQQFPIGPDWIDAYHSRVREQVGAYAQWGEENPDALASIRRSKPKNQNDAALQAYYALFDRADTEGWSASEISQEIDSFEKTLSSDQLDYIQRNTGLNDTARVKEYKTDQRQLEDYWNISDEVFARMRDRLPNGARFASLQDWVNDQILQMQNQGLPDQSIVLAIQRNPVIQQIGNATQVLQDRYRRANPAVDLLLRKWYSKY